MSDVQNKISMTVLVTLLAMGAALYCFPGYSATHASPLNPYSTEHRQNTRHRRSPADSSVLYEVPEVVPEVLSEVVPPVIYNQTLGPIYIKNSNEYTHIYCNATKGATISWKYEGQNISNTTIRDDIKNREHIQFHVELWGSRLLIFDQSHKAINGYVQCFVSNKAGATFGDKVFVSHAVLDFVGDERRTLIDAIEGEDVTLSCDKDFDNDPAAHVLWFFEATSAAGEYQIEPRKHPNFFCNDLMTVCVMSNLTHHADGMYRCSYNIPNTPRDISKAFRLTVKSSESHPRPRHPLNLMDHISSPSLVESQEGNDVGLQCAFRGNKGDRVTWMYAKADVSTCSVQEILLINSTDDLVLEKDGTFLLIRSLTAEKEGYYMCVADNGYDRYSHRIHVKLVAAPVLAKKIHGEEAYLGTRVRFNCSTSQAIPPATAAWWVNMQQIPESGWRQFYLEDGGNVLVLENATLEDTGSITCNVSNKVGSVIGHRYVTVRNVTLTTTTEVPTTVHQKTEETTPNLTTKNLETRTTTASPMTTSPPLDTTVDSYWVNTDHDTSISPHVAETLLPITDYLPVEKSSIADLPDSKVTSQTGYNVILNKDAQEGVRSHVTGVRGSEVNVERIGGMRLTIILSLVCLIVGLILGILIGWCVMRRHIRKEEATPDVIATENLSKNEFRRSPVHRLQIDGTTNRSETQSMMHQGSVQETIT